MQLPPHYHHATLPFFLRPLELMVRRGLSSCLWSVHPTRTGSTRLLLGAADSYTAATRLSGLSLKGRLSTLTGAAGKIGKRGGG